MHRHREGGRLQPRPVRGVPHERLLAVRQEAVCEQPLPALSAARALQQPRLWYDRSGLGRASACICVEISIG